MWQIQSTFFYINISPEDCTANKPIKQSYDKKINRSTIIAQ